MSEWLFSIIQAEEPDRRPDFARTSALNWMQALSAEIDGEHGSSVEEQWSACQNRFTAVEARAPIPHLAAVFEPLYASVTYATSLVSLARKPSVEPWRCAGAIVEWYYAVYNAFRAILSATDQPAPETHAKVANVVNAQIRPRLPHPLDMHAIWVRNEEFEPKFPCYPSLQLRGGSPSPLTETFDGSRKHAQQMLLSYLRGTAGYYLFDIKASMLASADFKRAGLTSFRTKEARSLRDHRLGGREFNFLHLAFRYRGKANYRDAVYLAYGDGQLAEGQPLAHRLANVARFVTLCALAYVERRAGDHLYNQFRTDLKANFRGAEEFRTDLE